MTRPFLRALLCAALLSLIASPVLAHAELVSAAPGLGDQVEGSPAKLVTTFSQNLNVSRTSREVRDASGSTVAKGGELGASPREFRLALPELAPGKYQVRWTSFSSEDGELARGSYTFTVVAAPSPSPSPSPSPLPSPTPTQSTSPSASLAPITPATPSPAPSAIPAPSDASGGGGGAVLILIGAALAVVGGIGIWLVRRRST